MAFSPSTTLVLHEPNGRVWRKRFKAALIATAQARKLAYAALASGTIDEDYTTAASTGTGNVAAIGGTGSYSDAYIDVKDTTSGKVEAHFIENMLNSFALAGSNGEVDISADAVIAFGTAYGGTVVGGHYVS